MTSQCSDCFWFIKGSGGFNDCCALMPEIPTSEKCAVCSDFEFFDYDEEDNNG